MNSITLAFHNAVLNSNKSVGDTDVLVAAQFRKQKDFKEGWSFSGSYKTFQALKAQGKIS